MSLFFLSFLFFVCSRCFQYIYFYFFIDFYLFISIFYLYFS